MSGDYGVLTWIREYYPAPDRLDVGFPGPKCWIGYFTEKVLRNDQNQVISEWDYDLAIKGIKEYLEEYYPDDERAENEEFWIIDLLDRLDEFDTEEGMYRLFNDFVECSDWHESKFGIKHTDRFLFQFEVLKSVSEQMRAIWIENNRSKNDNENEGSTPQEAAA